jgi:prophage DNA circulation protein
VTTPAETFQKASFGGIAFPVLRVSVKGGIRHYEHEFPHSPGAEVEKMGRRLYSISMTAFFHDVPDSRLAEEYPDLYPDRLNSLRAMFEQEKTAPLVIPNLGTIQAVALEWNNTFDFGGALSGEAAEFSFIEDQDRDFVFENMELGRGQLERKNFQLQGLLGTTFPQPPSIFQAINDAVTAVLAVQGLADAFSKTLEAKLLQVASLCEQADRIATLQVPENFAILEALKEVWRASTDLLEDLLGRQSPIVLWTVPALMTAAQISTAIFGSSEKGIDILQMNQIEDAYAIPAGTTIRYYREG